MGLILYPIALDQRADRAPALNPKAFRRWLRQLMRVTFVATKVTKSAHAGEAARCAGSLDSRPLREFPNSLQSLRSFRSDMRKLSFRSTLRVSAPSQADKTQRQPQPCRPGLDPGSSDFAGFDQSRWIPQQVRDDSKGRGAGAFAFAIDVPAVNGAEKCRDGRNQTKRCLSEASQTRSEFFSSRPDRASQSLPRT